MAKIYIDNKEKQITKELPKYGSFTVKVQDGKVVDMQTVINEKP